MAKSKKKQKPSDGYKVLTRNRKATHDYTILSRMEAGIVLVGSEVKSLRASKASIKEAFIEIQNGEAFLMKATIEEYPFANIANHEITRKRKLLLHRREITQIDNSIARKGYTALALSLYLKDGKIKVEVGLAQGRRDHEKRQAKVEKMMQREVDRELSRRQKG